MIDPETINNLETAREVIRQLVRRLEALEREVAELKGKLEEARRAGKRQAGPFSKGAPKEQPRKPGQKDGHAAAHRAIPEHVDRVKRARLASRCECGGRIVRDDEKAQYQIEMALPIPTIVTRFDVEIGHCCECGKRHQGRDAEQTSDALGAAGVQIGPTVMGLAAELKHGYGLAYGAIAKVLSSLSGLKIERSTLVRGDERIGVRLSGTYEQLILRLRKQEVIYSDETGWRVGGRPAWLWVFSSSDIAIYTIDPTRAHEVIERILTRDFGGVLKCDCFAAYDHDALENIRQSKCLGHLIRRSADLQEEKSGRAVVFSRDVAVLLRAALDLKGREAGLSAHGYGVARGRLEARLERLLECNYSDPDNARLAKLLRTHRHQLFNFLAVPGCDATNNAAERAIRPAVIIRKTNGCNRTLKGARTHEVIVSVLTTCRKQSRNFIAYVATLLRCPQPAVLDFAVAGASP